VREHQRLGAAVRGGREQLKGAAAVGVGARRRRRGWGMELAVVAARNLAA